jgi:hypothetical protein
MEVEAHGFLGVPTDSHLHAAVTLSSVKESLTSLGTRLNGPRNILDVEMKKRIQIAKPVIDSKSGKFCLR